MRSKFLSLVLGLIIFGQPMAAHAGIGAQFKAFCLRALNDIGVGYYQSFAGLETPITANVPRTTVPSTEPETQPAVETFDGKNSIAEVLKFHAAEIWKRPDLQSDRTMYKPFNDLTKEDMASVILTLPTLSRQGYAGGQSIGLETVTDHISISQAEVVASRASIYSFGDKNDPISPTLFVLGTSVFVGAQMPGEDGAQQSAPMYQVIHPVIKKLLLNWVYENMPAEKPVVAQASKN